MPEDWGRARPECSRESPRRRREPLRGGGGRPRGRGEEAPPARSPPPPHCRSYLPKNNSGPRGPGGAATVPRVEPEEACRARARREPGAPGSLVWPSGEEEEEEEGLFPAADSAAGTLPAAGLGSCAPRAPLERPRSPTRCPARLSCGPGHRAQPSRHLPPRGRRRRRRRGGLAY